MAGATIPEALAARAEREGGEMIFHLEEETVSIPAAELAERAQAAARALAARGVEPGDTVGVLGPNRPEWAVWAYATWAAGATLVPMPIPLRVRDPGAFSERLASFAEAAACRVVMADPRLTPLLPDRLGVPWELPAETRGPDPEPPAPDDAAVIQFTSGSTASPKGAVVTHRAVMAQMEVLEAIIGTTFPEQLGTAWPPFFHDLGLFCYLVPAGACGLRVHLIPTERFARDPVEWLRILTSTRSRGTAVPPSAFGAAVRAAAARSEKIDLSALEIAWFAAEGVDPAVADRLLASGAQLGLDPTALGATYGLAEAVLAVTSSALGEGMRFDHVDLAELTSSGLAAPAGDRPARRVISCGRPPPSMQVRIFADGSLPERHVGEVQVRGPSLMRGYLGPEVPDPFLDGWLRTGDLGYVADGELYITGRAKDMIVVTGHNYYPEDFEWAAGRLAGVRAGRSVAFSGEGDERIVLLVEPASEDADVEALRTEVRHAVTDSVGVAPGEVLVVPRGSVEKTTSGKLRRAAMKEAHRRGELTAAALVGGGGG